MRRALALTLLLAGCAPLVWTRPDTTAEQARADALDCQQRAWQEAQWRWFTYGPIRPWRYWHDPFWADRYYDEAQLARFCMEIRGYMLQSVPR